jgi:transcriptional regulator with XRE-family HTH domain
VEKTASSPAGSAFGRLVRHWRLARRLSQIGLAADAEISARHLCFLETGRARPSREMVQRLAGALELPLGERNALLVAAGYAATYGARPLDAPELEHIRRALQFILRQQEPYPALVVDGGWNTVMRNEAARRIFGLFAGPPAASRPHAGNALHAICHPQGLRRFIANWEEFAGPLIQALHREAAGGANVTAARLRDELLAYPGMPARWKVPDPDAPAPPLLTMRLEKGDLRLAFFSTLTTLATPRDVTLEQLRIECFYPADGETEATARRLAADAAHVTTAPARPTAP